MRPKKKFGQHFLTSEGHIQRIVRLAEPFGQPVLEIGPGKGALTRALIEAGADVHVVEVDPDMVQIICNTLSVMSITSADASTIDFSSWREKNNVTTSLHCVSNLPYNIGTKIIKNMLLSMAFSRITVMVQREVALRMMAEPGARNRGSLSSFVQAFCEVQYGFIVPPGAFFPAPKVDSAVFQMTPYPVPKIGGMTVAAFDNVNRGLFAMPRKNILNNLRRLIKNPRIDRQALERLLKRVEIDPRRRPATLSNPEIVKILIEVDRMRSIG